MAAPHVAGVAALMLAANPMLTPAKVEETLKSTAKGFGGFTGVSYGTGIVDASRAVEAVRIVPVGEIPGPSPKLEPGQVFMDGVLRVGETITSSVSGWEPAPVNVTYEWFVGGNTTPVATGSTYTLSPNDLGLNVAVVATGTKEGYEPASSELLSPGPVAYGVLTAGTPTISGSATVGGVLTADDGQWGPAPVSLTRQWLRNGSIILGASGTTYTAAPGDAGAKISVRVTGSKGGYQMVSQTSSETSIGGVGFAAPTPTISGARYVGQKLTAVPGSWSPAPEAFSYQWLRSGAAINGATSSTYTLTSEDFDQMIAVRVTGTKAGYPAQTVQSLWTNRVLPGKLSGPDPVMSGIHRVGETLKTDVGTWAPAANIAIQWMRNGLPIEGETSSTYTIKREDVGWAINVKVTATLPGYETQIRFAPSTTNVVDVTSDFSGDGNADVLARDTAGALWLYPGNGSGGWKSRVKVGSGWNGFTSIVEPGDFNGDGNTDVLARDTKGVLWLYPGNGNSGWKSRVKVGSGWQGFTSIVGPGDFTGDGAVDVLARDKYGALWMYPGNGLGGWKSRVKVGSGWQGFTSIVGPGDFNGDGAVDVMARTAAGDLLLYSGNGAGGWAGGGTKIGSGWQNFTSIVGPGDFNGDTTMDVLARDKAGVLWLYPGGGLVPWGPRVKVGSGWNIFSTIL
ncbi:S8 family serine peptidase [Arthrobacter sp. JZ12]|nr:S8 family serine peptidase [Arthrobacter sp. JZ12]